MPIEPEEQAFRDAMAADPHDAHVRAVYADWLDEHGQAEPARRLRLWAKVLPHVVEKNFKWAMPNEGAEQPKFPVWLRQLVHQRHFREFFKDRTDESNTTKFRTETLPASELKALGLDVIVPKHAPYAASEEWVRGIPNGSPYAGLLPQEEHAAKVAKDNQMKLARPEDYDRVAEDIKTYRQHVRPRFPTSQHGIFNTAAEHPFMHAWFTNRGLKVQKSQYTYYDEQTHTLHHTDPEDKSAVVHAYLKSATKHVKLARPGGLRKHPEIATLLRQIAESPEHDATLHGVLADRISELTGPDDPRAETVRHAVPEDDYGGLPGGRVTWPLSEERGDGMDPLTAYHDSMGTIRTGMELRGVGPHNADWSYPFTPAVEWHVQLPRGPYVKFVRLHTPESLHYMIDRLPARYRKAWREAAVARGWHDPRPTKLSRVGQMKSDTHNTRLAVARHVLTEAGVSPAQVMAVLAHTDARGVRPGVAAMVGKPLPPVLARYVAAWMGLLTGEKQMTVFHPGDGEDTLHIIDSPHTSEHVGEYLKRAGVRSFSMQAKGAGTRAFIVSPMDLGDVQNAANGLQGQHSAVRGTAVRLGAGTDAGARSAYRQVIDDAEKAAGGQ